jgi:hypothetical protein
MLKEYDGLGVFDLRELNLYLLGYWIGRYVRDKDKIWKMLIDFKYKTSNQDILTYNDIGSSNSWKGVMWAAWTTKFGFRWKVGNEVNVRFWEDIWIGSSSLAIQY